MKVISLAGEWQVRQDNGSICVNGIVPGCIHDDLLREKVIPDPDWRENEKQLQWIGSSAWEYSRAFQVSAAVLSEESVILRAEGLDTLALVTVNGTLLGRCDNMHRTWEWDIRSVLKPGRNTITVRFEPVLDYMKSRGETDPLPAWNEYYGIKHRGWLRKAHCNFGWDWSPVLVTCGVWRPISIVAYSGGRFCDVRVSQEHAADSVKVSVRSEIEMAQTDDSGYAVMVEIRHRGKIVDSAREIVRSDKTATVSVTVKDPHLWWPAGMGKQPLYDVRVTLLTSANVELDAWKRRIGLRTLRFIRQQDEWGESIRFEANGVAFFAKGTNWVPPLPYSQWPDGDGWKRLLHDAVTANCNMIRMWGGAYYAPDEFFDYCDTIGLTVWQDLLFACGPYPLYDEAFVNTIEQEFRDNVRRLRHHPCMALWCGNNELEPNFIGPERKDQRMAFSDYDRVFNGSFAQIAASMSPEIDYWPASPVCVANGRKDNDPGRGDVHIWELWFSDAPFEKYRNYPHRFISEFGFQSMPHPKTISSFALSHERALNSPVMEHHQRSGPGNKQLVKFLMEWFRLPTAHDDFALCTQLVQANCLKTGVEHFRRGMPRTMGALYWQLNDCWPCMSWSSIDFAGRWKALHWFVRRFFAPVMISGVEDTVKGTIDIWLTNERVLKPGASIVWRAVALDGTVLREGTLPVSGGDTGSRLAGVVDIKNCIEDCGAPGVWFWMELNGAGVNDVWNLVLFDRPRTMDLRKARLKTTVHPGKSGSFEVLVTCEKPSLWAFLETRSFDTHFSDNFRPLLPGQVWSVTATPSTRVSKATFIKELTARDVYDMTMR